ncbi:manganese/zinc/iron transport system permease protein [Arcanobacterium wilhelmae]|uniref:Manganese/zinc/iron transport system permease protein n=1 Tax=Arcanobacterium wilhelmae TaxID=1803177 RepID=A0ABT9N9Z9_9ACTO|nr:metal ABC transporter permease [Arcanobacterium wilhelmae]MDP9800343.1 manganese/zinc/iron transport system permease protein [Arcanobacterium wilhelmae]WFN89779.1 metal ABC transporter permease [Arcanobacterium wilhelmae]
MSFIAAAFLLASVTALTCALPGVFIVLRGQSMLIDAISHAVLPGIVIGVAITGTLHSPVMTAAATAMGLLIVWTSNWLRSRRLVTGDADQGVLFPALFALGVLLMSTVFRGVHVSENTVLAGDLNLMALRSEHVIIDGINYGPAAMWPLVGVFALTAAYIVVFYRVLKVAIFDREFALTAGMPVVAVENGLMVLVALTVVSAFAVAGSILVVALMICPAAVALLFARRLSTAIAATGVVALASALAGFAIAWKLELPTSAAMAALDGVMFVVAALARKIGLEARGRSR